MWLNLSRFLHTRVNVDSPQILRHLSSFYLLLLWSLWVLDWAPWCIETYTCVPCGSHPQNGLQNGGYELCHRVQCYCLYYAPGGVGYELGSRRQCPKHLPEETWTIAPGMKQDTVIEMETAVNKVVCGYSVIFFNIHIYIYITTGYHDKHGVSFSI